MHSDINVNSKLEIEEFFLGENMKIRWNIESIPYDFWLNQEWPFKLFLFSATDTNKSKNGISGKKWTQ